jgi:nicotinate-nucleotide adenylyltransferase
MLYAFRESTLNVAVFGGSFNPPHVAHVLACTLLVCLDDVDRIVVVPTFKHPFAKSLAAFGDRVKMCEIAMAWMPRVEVSRIEEEIGGESRTLRTLQVLCAAHPDWRPRLVIGADVLAEAPRWQGFDAITRMAPPIVLGRPGFDDPGHSAALLPDVSSSRVRADVARGAWDEVQKVVPRHVVAFIRERGLYAHG